MKAIFVKHERYEEIIALTDNGKVIGYPFYIADDDGVVTIFNADLSDHLTEYEAHMAILDPAGHPDFHYDMRTEWNVQQHHANDDDIFEIVQAEDGRYEIV